jgi:hypothetical protein
MALPLILSLLGSGAAGAGLFGAGLLSSPLLAGAIGSGLGTAIQTGDLGKGIQSGLTAGLLGGIGGMFAGGAGAATAAGADGVQGLMAAAPEGAATGLKGLMARMPSGFQPTVAGQPAAFMDAAKQGLGQGILTGGGLGAALPGALEAMTPTMPKPEEYKPTYGEAVPFQRNVQAPPPGFRPGIDPEFQYFDRYSVPTPPRLAGGGMLRYTPAGMSEPIRMQAGGIADMMPGAQPEMPQMNDKDLVNGAISAIKGEMPEETAAVVLGQFLQQFGEEAFRKLVDDVQSGRADAAGGDMEGTVRGPGDGMDDLVPATMDDGSQDVLLSDGEFIVPADVVSGLGNGSTDAGAEELHRMMDRVRRERTGRTEQARQVAAGGLMPA